MKKLSFLIITCLFFSLNVYSADTAKCVNLESFRGDNCGSPDSIRVNVTNRCAKKIYVRMCQQRSDGKWTCGSDSALKPGSTNTGFYTCHATGKYEWNSCTGGYKECGFKK